MNNEDNMMDYSGILIPISMDGLIEKEENKEKQRFPFVLSPQYKPVPSFSVGNIILERYTVKAHYHGAMGDVYQCYDKYLRDDVALKTLISDKRADHMNYILFIEEVQQRLHLDFHPNVTSLMLVENIDGYPYIISEWVEGDAHFGNSLSDWIGSYPFTIDEIVDFMLQLCKGLCHCHKQLSTDNRPFVLGDLKPENILVAKDHTFKLMDFSTHSYTINWASPEQKKNEVLDERSDIYTLGLIAKSIFSQVDTRMSESPLGKKVKNLIENCTVENLEHRMPSYETLQMALLGCCEEFQIPVRTEKIHYRTFLDCLYRLYSEINMGWNISNTTSLMRASYARSLYTQNFIRMEEYMEFTRNEDRNIYEAEAARQKGNFKEALRILSSNYMPEKKSPKFFYIRGLIYCSMNELSSAVENFEMSSKNELYYPALNIMADLLLQNPALTNKTDRLAHVKTLTGRIKQDIKKNATGYMVNQVYGKFLMLLGDYKAASCAFQESLWYPNPTEWNNLYFFGICEYRQKNIYAASTIFYSTIQEIISDPNYLEDRQKAITLLGCYYTLGEENQTVTLASDIYKKYGYNYQNFLDSLRYDLNQINSYFERIKVAEEHCDGNLNALKYELLNQMRVLEQEKPILNDLLMSSVFISIAYRVTELLFNEQKYGEATEICDRALFFDHSHPGMLQNKGACLFMNKQIDQARKYYELAIHYEQDPQKNSDLQTLLENLSVGTD